MNCEIKIGQFSIILDGNVNAVTAPNVQMEAMFKGMRDTIVDLRIASLAAERDSEALEAIRKDTDLNDAARARRQKEAINPDTLKDFRKGAAAVSEQAGNILAYLKRELQPVTPLAADDVQGFLRDSELRKVFRLLDGATKSRLISAMHRGEQKDLCDAVLRASPLCSDMTGDQFSRLSLSRISSDNTPVVQAVSDLVTAARKDLRQITAVRAWYTNLVFGSNYDPEEMEMRVTGLDNLADYAHTMLKINQRQNKTPQSEDTAEQPETADIQQPVDPEEAELAEWRAKWKTTQPDMSETA